jgi:hypothetical protein
VIVPVSMPQPRGLRRVLRPGGRLIAAIDHPFAIELMHRAQTGKPGYFQTRSRTEEWTLGGHSAPMTSWDRPPHAMTDAFTAAGFRIAVISEPPAAPDTPRELSLLSSRAGRPSLASCSSSWRPTDCRASRSSWQSRIAVISWSRASPQAAG